MRQLHIGILDLVSKGPVHTMWARVMNANLASIMPQVVGVWCQRQGHHVTMICYTGAEDLETSLPDNLDIVFIGAFTESAHTAYALSNRFRSAGAVTVLGGPHARCYPQDARQYFDYVLGLTDETVIREILLECSPQRPLGVYRSALRQPEQLPGVRERWDFISPTLKKAPLIKMVPMLASLGCPYTCSFCIDASIPHQTLDYNGLSEDLRFLLTKFKRPLVGWHDPNFGVCFDDIMDVIERAIPADSIDFVAESSLSLLSESHMIRLKQNGFNALLPGIESWFTLGNKSRTGALKGEEKVRQVADHVNMILRHIPYIQTNFVLGLDSDEGTLPFELTKRFVDLAPGAFPGYSLMTSFGQAAPINLEYQRANRVIPFPFHFLNNNGAMNIKPKNYDWAEFYEHVVSLTRHSFSTRAIARRVHASSAFIPKWLNVVRACSSEGFGRIRYYSEIHRRLTTDRSFRAFFEGESTTVPQFYIDRIRKDLGPLWDWLPRGSLEHDVNAYLKSQSSPVSVEQDAERMVA